MGHCLGGLGLGRRRGCLLLLCLRLLIGSSSSCGRCLLLIGSCAGSGILCRIRGITGWPCPGGFAVTSGGRGWRSVSFALQKLEIAAHEAFAVLCRNIKLFSRRRCGNSVISTTSTIRGSTLLLLGLRLRLLLRVFCKKSKFFLYIRDYNLITVRLGTTGRPFVFAATSFTTGGGHVGVIACT